MVSDQVGLSGPRFQRARTVSNHVTMNRRNTRSTAESQLSPAANNGVRPRAPTTHAARANGSTPLVEDGVSSRMVIRLVRLLELRGYDPRPVCAASGVSLEELADPSARIPYVTADRLLDTCAARLGA